MKKEQTCIKSGLKHRAKGSIRRNRLAGGKTTSPINVRLAMSVAS